MSRSLCKDLLTYLRRNLFFSSWTVFWTGVALFGFFPFLLCVWWGVIPLFSRLRIALLRRGVLTNDSLPDHLIVCFFWPLTLFGALGLLGTALAYKKLILRPCKKLEQGLTEARSDGMYFSEHKALPERSSARKEDDLPRPHNGIRTDE